jgi:fumarate reductase subunit D
MEDLGARAKAKKMAMYIFDYNGLETTLLISSIFVLLSGMIFQSNTFDEDDLQYQLLVFLTAIIIIGSTMFVMGLLVFELYRSVRYANFMLKVRQAEMRLYRLNHLGDRAVAEDRRKSNDEEHASDSGFDFRKVVDKYVHSLRFRMRTNSAHNSLKRNPSAGSLGSDEGITESRESATSRWTMSGRVHDALGKLGGKLRLDSSRHGGQSSPKMLGHKRGGSSPSGSEGGAGGLGRWVRSSNRSGGGGTKLTAVRNSELDGFADQRAFESGGMSVFPEAQEEFESVNPLGESVSGRSGSGNDLHGSRGGGGMGKGFPEAVPKVAGANPNPRPGAARGAGPPPAPSSGSAAAGLRGTANPVSGAKREKRVSRKPSSVLQTMI